MKFDQQYSPSKVSDASRIAFAEDAVKKRARSTAGQEEGGKYRCVSMCMMVMILVMMAVGVGICMSVIVIM